MEPEGVLGKEPATRGLIPLGTTHRPEKTGSVASALTPVFPELNDSNLYLMRKVG